MHITVEISMYPLTDGYLPAIDRFIDTLLHAGLQAVKVNAMSTQISGAADDIFALLQQGITQAYEAEYKSVFVCKVLPGALDLNYTHGA